MEEVLLIIEDHQSKKEIFLFDDIKTPDDLGKYEGRWLTEKLIPFIKELKDYSNKYKYVGIHYDIFELIKFHYMNSSISEEDIDLIKSILVIPKYTINTIEFI